MQTAAVRTAAVWLDNYTNLVNIMLRKKFVVVDVRLTAHYIESISIKLSHINHAFLNQQMKITLCWQ